MASSRLSRESSGLPTTAAKIRALAAKGQPRADIARALGIRYQQVRNVLLRDEEKAKAADGATLTDASSPGKVVVAADGSVVVPSSIIGALALKAGNVLFVQTP